jgi:hypothetical protein
MTFTEYYEKVAHLGFDSDIEDFRDQFVDAMNRAFKQVTRIRPRMGILTDISLEEGHGIVKIDVKESIKDDYGSLPMNPVRMSDGTLYRSDRYIMLNRNTVMFLPSAEAGLYMIDYIRRTPTFNYDNFESDEDVDIDDDLSDALVLIVAYYTFLDDDESKATNYLSRAMELLSEIKATQATHSPGGYKEIVRW